jgi:subtilisin family serine protease
VVLQRALAVFVVPVSLAVPLGAGSPAVAEPEAVTRGSHVVSYDADRVTVDQLEQAVEDASGEVVDVLEPLGVALVSSQAEDFLSEVTARDGVVAGGARNRAVGAEERSAAPTSVDPEPRLPRGDKETPTTEQRRIVGQGSPTASPPTVVGGDPLEGLQWGNELVGATPDQAHRTATGAGVTVGVIDTGVDGSHPDLAGNIDLSRSRDLVQRQDGVAIDPHGHGTHVAGTVAAGRNDLGIAGVAPEATLVNLRAGNDQGYFFVYEVASALVTAGERGVDVAVMSFYTDPWLYNCASADDYVSGSVSDEEIAEQAFNRKAILDAVAFAQDRGVTLVAAAGNEGIDLAAAHREDTASPGFPPGEAEPRVVTNNCLDLPNEAPGVISVSSVGPSSARAEYSNYGLGSIDLAAPGGWFNDFAGTDRHRRAENLVLSSYPLAAADHWGLVDENGEPTDATARRDCDGATCGFYRFLEGTSMAAPHVAGVAALVVERGKASGSIDAGSAAAPDQVASVLSATATARSCLGQELCQGTDRENSVYGRGIVDAAAAAADAGG